MLKKTPDRHKNILDALEEALARLVHGNPNNVRPGYRISVNAVCQEASISRQTFYKRYRTFETKIHDAAAKVGRPTVSRSRRRELDVRAENEILKARISELMSQHATLLHRAVTAEEQAKSLGERNRLSALPASFAGRAGRAQTQNTKHK